MNKIAFPLKQNMQGAAVADLQDALQLLLDRAVVVTNHNETRQALAVALKGERAAQTFGKATSKLVTLYQDQHSLPVTGEVDQATATALNAELRKLGMLDSAAAPDAASRIVSGRVRSAERAAQQLLVRAEHQTVRGSIRLGEDTTDTEGRYSIRYELLPEVEAIHLRVLVIDVGDEVLHSSVVIRDAQPREIVDINLPKQGAAPTTRRIEGQVRFPQGAPAAQLLLRLYRLGFGGKANLLDERRTLAEGRYAFEFGAGNRLMRLEVRAVRADAQEIALCKPFNQQAGDTRARLNLIAPADLQPLAAEYRRLVDDLTPHLERLSQLANAREDDERQDLSVLNRATGWDARLIALAATSERLSADPDVQLPPQPLYGLLRAGLPSDKTLLAQVEPEVALQALKTVRDAGIVALDEAEIAQFKQQFTLFANKARLNLRAPGARASYGQLLNTSGLSAQAQSKFAPVFLNHRGDGSALWQAARNAGLDETEVGKLQLHGKLAFLAGNSAGMIARLMQKSLSSPLQLIAQGFHQADTWVAEVLAQVGIPLDHLKRLNAAEKLKLSVEIPAVYAADSVEGRLSAYAVDMARKLRLSYPTEVIGQLIDQGRIALPKARVATVGLLQKAAAKGFRLGETPVDVFLKQHSGLQSGMSEADFRDARQQLKALQRVYQITPGNEAIPVLMDLGMHSAFDVMAYPEAEFAAHYARKYFELHDRYPSSTESDLVYRKAKQVSSVTYSLFAIAKKMESEPAIAGMSAPVAVRESVRNELIKQFPTMESLFGSLDYCECDHCRSVLSPAAYLVDLLQFVDAEPAVWGNFLAQWKATHAGQDFPHQNKTGAAMTPYDVLIERRPDLPHIALSCENTHTAMPYIDVVNEILEYYVAHGKLEEQAAQDTSTSTSAELLAEPQNLIGAAYGKLAEARYPITLPFDLPLESMRQFCEYLQAPLPEMLDVLRQSDDLFDPAKPFDRFRIFMESLRLSPAEISIFTDPDPLKNWQQLYGFKSVAQATTMATDATGQRIDLHSAKALSRRLDVSYKEIVEIVQSGFVNPKLNALGLLHKLGISVQEALFYLEHRNSPAAELDAEQQRQQRIAAFDEALDSLATQHRVPKARLEVELQTIPFRSILVLADPEAGCNFDLTTLRFANGDAADPITFLKINFFVRLWRKLDWTIEETDRALQVFVPTSTPFVMAHLARQPLTSALLYLAHLKALDQKLGLGKSARIELLTLWSDLPTQGKNSLYARLFLTESVLRNAPEFDHPLGQYLTTAGVKLKNYLLTLQGALGLTSTDIASILEDARITLDSAELSIANVSLLYRYALLSKALKLPLAELIALKALSGLDPFKRVHPEPLADTAPGVAPAKKAIELDHPFTQTIRFVEVVEEVRDSGFRIADLEYLLRHRFDVYGTHRQNPQDRLALLKLLSDGVRTIRNDQALPAHSSAVSDADLRQQLGRMLPVDVVDRFLAMVNGTAEFTATQTGVTLEDSLDAKALEGEPSIRQVAYHAVRREQKLTLRGVLFDARKTRLKGQLPKPAASEPHVQSAVLNSLLDDVQRQARTFFETHLQKRALSSVPQGGFLEALDFDLLFDPELALAASETEEDRIRQRHSKIANAFLPVLQQQLIRQFIVQTMSGYLDADPQLVESLLTDQRLLDSPGALVNTLTATAIRGVDAAFFAANDATGIELARMIVADADTGLLAENAAPLMPATANSARFKGYLEVPRAGAYRFNVRLDKAGAAAELRFAHLPEPLFLSATAAADHTVLGEQASEFLELKSGVLYQFSLTVRKLSGGHARLCVQGETVPMGRASQLSLSAFTKFQGAEHAVALLSKVLYLAHGLNLKERELRYVLMRATAFDGLNLSRLPTQSSDDTLAGARTLFAQFLRLAAYTQLKRELAGNSEDLVDIFAANDSTDADRLNQRVYPLMANLMRKDQTTVRAAANALFVGTPSFDSEKSVQQLWRALQVCDRFGVAVDVMQKWVGVVGASVTPQQRFEIAYDLRQSIKARFEPATWQRVAQPIFDTLRQRQRDALVAYVMHQLDFARKEQLYEHFLIDPGMEPVVQTSRIRVAIASLQLFIQRSLLNMEPKVHPSTVNSKQWDWMKRYRVWEANRKLFLFPENWLEPEFRDDKTELFGELEGALLQGDVSADVVDDAFFNYLRKLDALARLDIVAMHAEDTPESAQRILHVIGRSYSAPYQYFYRRYLHQAWSAWQSVSADIQGDHIAPVVWRDRLHLFWVTFIEKAEPPIVAATSTSEPKFAEMKLSEVTRGLTSITSKRSVEAHLHWSEYVHGAWSNTESSGFDPTQAIVTTGLSRFDSKSVFIHVTKTYEAGEERGVNIHLGGTISQSFHLAGRNSALENGRYANRPENPYNAGVERSNRFTGNGDLRVTFVDRASDEPGKTTHTASPSILDQGSAFILVPCNNNLTAIGVPDDAYAGASDPVAAKAAAQRNLDEISSLMKPVFYHDQCHTLFVEPSVTERTIEEWQEWVTRPAEPEPDWRQPDAWRDIAVVPETPKHFPAIELGELDEDVNTDSGSIFDPVQDQDWLANRMTALDFDGVLIGASGARGAEVLGAGGASANGMNVVSGGGFTAALKKNFSARTQSGIDARKPRSTLNTKTERAVS